MDFHTTNQNPVKFYRKERDLEPTQFAKFVGVSVNSIYRVENGYPATLPSRIENTLNEIEDGLGDDLAKEYAEWREQERQKVLSSQD